MNILRIKNGNISLPTTFSLTINIDKKDIEHDLTIVILSDEEIEDKSTLLKLKGVCIDVLIVPKKLKSSFNEKKYYKEFMTQLTKEHKITYY